VDDQSRHAHGDQAEQEDSLEEEIDLAGHALRQAVGELAAGEDRRTGAGRSG